MNKREQELGYYKKLNKTDLLARTMGYYDAVQNNLQLIHELRSEHKAEIKNILAANDQELKLNEEWYNNSNSYAYVKQILDEIAKTQTERDQYYHDLVELKENGYEDLRKENQALRNKIVRMA